MKPLRLNRGFSLVELMVALVLGLLLVVSLGSVFVGSRQAFRTQEGLGEIQEGGRFLNYLMVPYVRMAGYLSSPLQQANPLEFFSRPGPATAGAEDNLRIEYRPGLDRYRALWGVDGNPAAARGTSASVSIADGTNARTVNYDARSDVLVVRYMGQDDPSDNTRGDGSIRTCQGLPAPPDEDDEEDEEEDSRNDASAGLQADHMAETVFFVSVASRTRVGGTGDRTLTSSLSCSTRIYRIDRPGGTPERIWPEEAPAFTQPLLENVEDLQILYGEDLNPADDDAPAGGVPGYFPDVFHSASEVRNWQRVVSVRIQAAVASTQSTEADRAAADRADDDPIGENERVSEGGRLRRVFTTTVNIRNRMRP